ncbi:MAG: PA14 domain-containing protein, partial [Anaerolineae bacterium]
MKHKRLTMSIVLALVCTVFGMTAFPAAAQGAWFAEYFTNRDLSGSPAVTRHESSIHFEWGAGSPDPAIPADNFSTRFTRDEFFEAGAYRFSYRSDDGIRIWVGNTLVVDDWRDRQAAWSFVDRFVARGTHRVRVEYYEHGGGAALQMAWEWVSGGSGWRAEYFNNRDLSGSPALVRFDPAIDFDWDRGSPDPAVPADNF